jgi:hypothetical protein
LKFTDVSEVLAASIIRVMRKLNARSRSQKTAIFMLATMRTSNLNNVNLL